jgi:DNA polymerase V
MIHRGILDGAIIVVDRAIEAHHGASIVASIGGEFVLKVLDMKRRLLVPANPAYKPVPIPEDLDAVCEGVATFSINPQQGFGV